MDIIAEIIKQKAAVDAVRNYCVTSLENANLPDDKWDDGFKKTKKCIDTLNNFFDKETVNAIIMEKDELIKKFGWADVGFQNRTADSAGLDGQWISVNDKMPEDLLSDSEKKTRKQIRCILVSGKRVFVGSRQRWKNTLTGEFTSWGWNRWSKITHWMPFPEPPKELLKKERIL